MKSSVEKLSPTRVKLNIEVPFDELKPSLDAAYQAIAKQVNIPGFRKGKVPPPVIDRQIGRGPVLDQAINDALPKFYGDALTEHDLLPIGQPEVDITKLEDNQELVFTVEVAVRPEITLPKYDGLKVKVADAVVTDADVEEQLQHLRKRFATFTEVDRAAKAGDFVTIDLAATSDGEAVEGGTLTGFSYQIGDEMLPGIDKALTGLKAGKEKTFKSQLPGGDLAGTDVDIAVTLTAVKDQELPELDEEFAQTASEFDTVAELTEDVRTRLAGGKRLEQAAEARDEVLQALLDQTDIPLPDEIVDAEVAGRRDEMNQQLAWSGMSMEQYLADQEQTQDEFDAELVRRVKDSIGAQFLLDEIVKKEEIGLEQEELSAHLMRRAQQSGQDPNEFIKHMVEHNHIQDMMAEVVRGKALALLVEGAEVKDASGNLVDLKNLRPDGSLADPTEAVEAEETPEA